MVIFLINIWLKKKKNEKKKRLKAKGDLTQPPLVLESLWERCAVNIFK